MKKLKTILLSNKYILLLLFTLLLSLLITNLIEFKSKYTGKENQIEGYIIDKKVKDNKLTITLKAKEKIIVYYEDNDIDLELNDYIRVYGKMYEPSSNSIPNTFNYKEYLYNKHIYYTFNSNKIEILKKNNNILYKVKNYMINRLDLFSKSKDYLNAFIIGNNTISNEDKNLFKELGIIHLFSISGMHISLFVLILKKLLKRFKYKYLIIIPFLLFYVFITGFQVSILRCFLCYTLKIINGKMDNKNILFLVCSILLLINPFYIYDTGFLYSFIITYSIIRYSSLNYIKISLISFFSSIPILINTNYSINFLSIICNIIFIPFVEFILFPLAIITYIFPFMDNTFYYLINIFIIILKFISEINIFTFSFSKESLIFIFLYYFLLYSKKKKLLIVLLLFFYFNNYYLFSTNIYFIDVGQGDSSLIRIKNKNYLIDTGCKDIKNIITFLKSIGVKKIDTLILTHGDNDHMGEAINLVKNFKVEKVIFNYGEYNDLEQELINTLDIKKIEYDSCIKELNIDNNKLYFLQTREYDNENDNSNVIYTELDGYKFMFMGDASSTTEKEILNKYNISDIDVLKVGHHGSKTSSSKEFIDDINPKYSIISVGKYNRYGHPNKEVLNNLEGSKIYRTDKDGSIMFKINGEFKIDTFRP